MGIRVMCEKTYHPDRKPGPDGVVPPCPYCEQEQKRGQFWGWVLAITVVVVIVVTVVVQAIEKISH